MALVRGAFVVVALVASFLSTLYLKVPMRNVGANQRRSPWIFRNNGNGVCSTGVHSLMMPMKISKVASSIYKNMPTTENVKKPTVRTLGQAFA